MADCVDLYYVHRVEPERDIEETIGTLADLKQEGKLKAIGLSEISAETLRRAHAVHPISAVQSEYSLWTREPERDVIPACEDLGVAFVAFSPLGRGMFTGPGVDPSQLEAQDFRRLNPRFIGESYRRNVAAIDKFRDLAADMGYSPSALALAWLVCKVPGLIAIPGTRTARHLEENIAANAIRLTGAHITKIEDAFPSDFPFGERYSREQSGHNRQDDDERADS